MIYCFVEDRVIFELSSSYIFCNFIDQFADALTENENKIDYIIE